MATVDIEAPGASEAALRAAIQALVPISTTTIASPVNYVDIDLPSGYSSFQLEVTGVEGGQSSNLIGAFSEDGGTTWIEDYAGGFDAYTETLFRRYTLAFQSTAYDSGVLDLSVSEIPTTAQLSISIDPGSASRPAMATASFSCSFIGAGETPTVGVVCTACRDNTQRVDAIRLMFDNAATGPSTPDPAYTIVAGAFTLYGVL